MTHISLVIPCYNEKDAIPVYLARVVPIMEATGHGYEMLFVDDGSRDKTLAGLTGF
jgi:glycosyltransferase involved in cell wall biosynthesis